MVAVARGTGCARKPTNSRTLADEETVEFETSDPAMQGETITYTLTDAGSGPDFVGLHENLPPGVQPADNELGGSISIAKLAKLIEHDRS